MKNFYHLLVVILFALPLKSTGQCNIPTGMNAIAITTIDAVLTWNPQAGVDTFKIRYAVAGTGAYLYRTVINTPPTNSVFITGLYPGTTYDWQVKSTCGAVSSSYSSVQNFTTVWGYMPCIRPFNTLTTGISNSSATLVWDTLISADTFRVRVAVLGTGAYTWRIVPGSPNLINYELSNLAPNTTYEWAVQTMCNGVLSSYSNQNIFTTLFGPTPCGKPYNIRVGNINANSAILNWSSNVTGDQFRCRYALNTPNPVWQYKTVTGLPAVTSMSLTGLVANSQYIFQVQTLCMGVTAGYGPVYMFNTLPFRIGANELQSTSILDLAQEKLYPNPASNEVFLEFNTGNSRSYQIKIYDLIGKERIFIDQKGVSPGLIEKRIDISSLPKGIYFAELSTAGKKKQFRFVIDK